MQNSFQSTWPTRSFVAAIALTISGAASAGMAQSAPPEVGLWIDDTGKGAVRIEPCGEKLCGRIAWLRDLVNDKGEVLRDRHNPDPSMRGRLICGLPVLGQLQAQPEGGYDGGWVYDPKVGKAFDVAILLTGQDELTVTGYKGIRLFSKSFVWTRSKAELPDCSEATAQLTGSGAPVPAALPSSLGAAKAQSSTPSQGDAKAQPAKIGKPQSDAAAAAPKPASKSTAQKSAPATKKTAKKEILPWSVAQP